MPAPSELCTRPSIEPARPSRPFPELHADFSYVISYYVTRIPLTITIKSL
ncbi:hypothetical protein HMPREF1868_00393 [Olsenella sp. DNF00959]|nr:hypothetical protein HMPREF1868_00393 [Olsenella sp. DNF00959]